MSWLGGELVELCVVLCADREDRQTAADSGSESDSEGESDDSSAAGPTDKIDWMAAKMLRDASGRKPPPPPPLPPTSPATRRREISDDDDDSDQDSDESEGCR